MTLSTLAEMIIGFSIVYITIRLVSLAVDKMRNNWTLKRQRELEIERFINRLEENS